MVTVKHYLNLVKFSHTIFALPFAMIGFFLGVAATEEGFTKKTIYLVICVLICMVTARSAAMAFNRYLDRHFDALNPRTAIREIPKGIIAANHALYFTILNAVIFIVTTYFINPLCFFLSPVAIFIILFYSYTKRFTAFCHLVLGLGLSLAPIGAYLAVTNHFDVLPVLFSFSVIFWVSGFDIIYALQDVEFDRSQRLFSIPAILGKKNALFVSAILHFLSAGCVIFAGIYGNFHWLYWIGILMFAGMLFYQHSLVKPSDLSKVNIAFMTANGLASVVFSLLVICDLILLQN